MVCFSLKDFKACIEPLLERRSIRRFKDEEVPLDLVLKALDVARYAPSARNSQPWEFIIIRSRKLLDSLATLHPGATPLKTASLAIAILADHNRSKSATIDASLAAMQLWLALHCLGLGAVWIQAVGYSETLRNILGYPEHMECIGILAVGWPAEKPSPKPRRPLEEIVHFDKYGEKEPIKRYLETI